jgi:O-antigen/teichoic acid export membrane protein
VLRVATAAGQIAISLFLLKSYGAAAVGLFAVFLSNTMLASLISRQGFDRTLTLFAVRPRTSHHALSLFRSYARLIVLWLPLAGALNVLAYLATVPAPPAPGTVVLLVALPTVVALSSLAAGYFTGTGRTAAATVQQPGFSVALTALVLATSFAIGVELDVYAAYCAVAALIAGSGLLRILRAQGAETASGAPPARVTRLARDYSRRFLVINFFTTFSSVYFISFLALFVAHDVIGQFRVVERLALVVAFNLTFINIILPAGAIGERLAKNQPRFDRAMRQTFLFQYTTGLAIFLAYLAFMNPIMSWIGVDNAYLYLLPLVAQLINALTGPVRVVLMYMGGQRVLQVSAVVETFGSALLYWFLYLAWGATGLAVAYLLAIAVPNILLAWIVHARYGIVPLPFVSPSTDR